jgi:hypothetical protein
MTDRPCPRCHALLAPHDASSVLYCWNCGAPQVRLSEELRLQAEQQHETQTDAASTASQFSDAVPLRANSPALDPAAVNWPAAIRVAALAGAIALGLGLLSALVEPIALLSLGWALSAPIVVLGIYSSRNKLTRIRPGFGARLGMMAALMIAIAASAVDVVKLLLMRFALHRGGVIDSQLTTVYQQFHAAQANQPPIPFLNESIPEFRVGFLLFSFAFGICLYLGYSTLAGAFGGMLRARSRTS